MPQGWNEHLNSKTAQLSLSAAAKFNLSDALDHLKIPTLHAEAITKAKKSRLEKKIVIEDIEDIEDIKAIKAIEKIKKIEKKFVIKVIDAIIAIEAVFKIKRKVH